MEGSPHSAPQPEDSRGSTRSFWSLHADSKHRPSEPAGDLGNIQLPPQILGRTRSTCIMLLLLVLSMDHTSHFPRILFLHGMAISLFVLTVFKLV